MYELQDHAIAVFHGLLVVFNLTGWIWAVTRRIHLIAIGLVVLSWFGLGAIYGWGYCPCTDWHWEVKRALGETDLPSSYVKYYADRLTGSDWDPMMVDATVLALALLALALSIWVNARDHFRRHRGPGNGPARGSLNDGQGTERSPGHPPCRKSLRPLRHLGRR